MRIVHVITRFYRAGSEENTLATCMAQLDEGHEVILIHGKDYYPGYYNSLDKRLKLIGVPTLVHHISPILELRAYRYLKGLFRKIRPDITHTHQSKAGIIGRLAAHAAGVPIVVHGVHIVPFVNVGYIKRFIYLMAEKAVAPLTHAFFDVSCGVRDLYLAAGIGQREQHHVVHSGFDLARFRNASPPEDWQELLQLDQNEPYPLVILMIAAFEPRKRHREFLEVFPKVVKCFPNIRLVLAGDGPVRLDIERQVKSLGLTRQVIFLGFREDPERLVALANLCLLTSVREGLPRVVMQYLAGGKPCVISELPGIEEILFHGKNGIIVPSNQIHAVADNIIALLENKEELDLLTYEAKSTDLSKWDTRKMGVRIGKIYQRLLNGEHLKVSGHG